MSDVQPDTQRRDRAAALTLIEASAVMTLAVAAEEGPWAAPVYYAFRPADRGFYFFSSPASRHIEAALATERCAATIFRSADSAWQDICGLQMQGSVAAAGTVAGAKALVRYLRKFPFSRDLLPAGGAALEAFERRLGVRLYRFRPERVEWTDNRIHFGYRCRLTL